MGKPYRSKLPPAAEVDLNLSAWRGKPAQALSDEHES
jgi:hypothetical protein